MRQKHSFKTSIAIFFIVSAFLFGAPQTSHAATSPFVEQLQNLLISLLSQAVNELGSSTQAGSPAQPQAAAQSSTFFSVIASNAAFGGPILPPTPIICTTPPGAIYAKVGSPKAKDIICQPGACKTYRAPPPYRTGQYLLGNVAPSLTKVACWVGDTIVGRGYLVGNTPGVGSEERSSTKSDTPSEKPPESSCPQSAFNINNSVTKQIAESAARDQFDSAGIRINNPSCGYGQTYQHSRQTLGRGCTDLSGLQCGTTNYITGDLASLCGAENIIVTGGSEAGHLTHSEGNTFDLAQSNNFSDPLSQCIKSNFTFDSARGVYIDPATGTTFLPEEPGQYVTTTGAHWHVCYSGTDCD